MKNHYMEFENNKYCLQGKYYKDTQYNKQHLEDMMKSLFFFSIWNTRIGKHSTTLKNATTANSKLIQS